MTQRRSEIMLLLAVIVVVLTGACSNVDMEESKELSTVTPTSVPDKSDMGVVTTSLMSGVEGVVWIGPTCPVVQVGTECPDEPYETELAVTDIEGNIVTNSKSDSDGFFRILLPPGSYVLIPETPNRNAPPFVDPIPFNVEPGLFTQLEVYYDSGMR
jgi:hypothetical protein